MDFARLGRSLQASTVERRSGRVLLALSPSDVIGAERLRDATVAWTTVAWAPLLDALHAVGLRPYRELCRGGRHDQLRLYCELDGDLLLDLSNEDDQIPDAPQDENEGDWAVFVQDADSNYLADVLIDPSIDYDELAHNLRELVDAITRGDRPMYTHW